MPQYRVSPKGPCPLCRLLAKTIGLVRNTKPVNPAAPVIGF